MLNIADKHFNSRLLLGTAQYPSPEILLRAIEVSKTEIITVSLRRQGIDKNNQFWNLLKKINCQILPNTAGCFSAKEAVVTAKMASELFETNWIKLEVIGDEETLQPNPLELIKAAEELIKANFFVLPYCTDDLILCKALVDMGCEVLMPLAAPIGTGKGIRQVENLQLLRRRFPKNKLIIDAGIGKPSHAAQAMELGFDAVLLNTAVAHAVDPINMAKAFSLSVAAGRLGYEAGLMPEKSYAVASTPTLGQPFILETKLHG